MADKMKAALLERAKREKARRAASDPKTNMLEQGMSGVNEGIGNILGAPVDLMTGAINSAAGLAGYDPMIENPVGGSQWINDKALGFSISDTQPQSTGQRVARRVGQEVGASTIPALGLLGRGAGAATTVGRGVDDMARAAQAAPGAFLGAEAAGAVGSGLGGAAAQEIAPQSALAEILGQVVGGGAAAGGMLAANKPTRAPTIDALKARQKAAYNTVDASPAQLTPEATQALQGRVQGRASADGMDPFLAPKASRVADKIGGLETPSISEVEKARRLVGRDVAGAIDPTERALGVGMKDEITDYLSNLQPSQVTGGDPADAIAALGEGRQMTQRIKKSQDINNRIYKAENRAASSGTGGNEVNAIRQNIRQILDDPRKRRGYSKEEIAAMESIVRGTPTQNALRMIGRFSPSAGALPAMAGVTAGAALGPLGAVPSAMGYLAKGGAEKLTRGAVGSLDEMIRSGGTAAGRKLSEAQKSALAALLAAQVANGQAGTQ